MLNLTVTRMTFAGVLALLMWRGGSSGSGGVMFQSSTRCAVHWYRFPSYDRNSLLLASLLSWSKRYDSTMVSVSNDSRSVSMTLRPYQEECINTCLEEFAKGITRQAVSLPVGSGKTVVFANLISRLPEIGPGGKKVLVLAHREELLAQAQRQIQRYAPHLQVSIERGKYSCDHENDNVIIASVPTLGRNLTNGRLQRFDPHQFKAIIIDEAHHAVAESYMRIMKHFGVEPIAPGQEQHSDLGTVVPAKQPALLVWGCSATFSRNDDLALGTLFEKIVYHLDISRLMQEGWLCRAEFREIYTKVDLEQVKVRKGDFDSSQLNLAINTPIRNDLVAATWHKVAFEEHKRRSTLIFALNVDHACNLSKSFLQLGIPTAIITGETAEVERRRILDGFSKGSVPVLLNCAVLTEGTDLPITDCIVMTRPTCNSNLYTQMVGRGLRKHKDKEYSLVLDFIDRLRSKNRTLVSFPSLFAARKEVEQHNDKDDSPTVRVRRGYAEINADDVAVKIRTRDSRSRLPSSPGFGLAWVQIDSHMFALPNSKSSFVLELDRNAPEMAILYSLTETRKPPIYGRIAFDRITIRNEFSLVYKVVPELLQILSNDQRLDAYRADAYWRRQRPMSQQQRVYLWRIIKSIPNVEASLVKDFFSWSVGRASDLISKYRLRYYYLRKPFTNLDDLLSGVDHY